MVAKAECKALGEDILNAFDVFAGSATWNCYCGAWSGIDKISNRRAKFDIRHSAFQVENKDHEMKGTAEFEATNLSSITGRPTVRTVSAWNDNRR